MRNGPPGRFPKSFQLDLSIEEAYTLATDTMVCNLGLDDATEGIGAFLEKRAPTWRGR